MADQSSKMAATFIGSKFRPALHLYRGNQEYVGN